MAKRGDLTGTSSDNKREEGFSFQDIIGATFDPGVKLFQEHLLLLGYSLPKFGADGSFGTETENAIKAFQKAEGLPITAKMDAATMARLTQRVSEKKGLVSTTTTQTQQSVPAGDLGDLQKQLQAYGQQVLTQVPGTDPTTVLTQTTDLPKHLPDPNVAVDWTKATAPGEMTPGVQQQTAAPPPPASDKILGLPKNVAIGGGIAVGVLALLGVYLMMRKDTSSKAESADGYQTYVDAEGVRWVMSP